MNVSQSNTIFARKQTGVLRTVCVFMMFLLGIALIPVTAMAQEPTATWRIQTWEQDDGGPYGQFAPFCSAGTPCTAVVGVQICVDGVVNCQTTAGSPSTAVFTGLSFGPHTACLTDPAWLVVSGSVNAGLDGPNCVTRDFTGDEEDPDHTTAMYVEMNTVEVVVTKAYTVAHPIDDPEVEFTLTCDAGTVSDTDPNIVEKIAVDGPSSLTNTATATSTYSTASFWVTGATECWATEVVPPGYVQSASTCGDEANPGITLPGTEPIGCTITNRPTEATFTVDKNFSDSNPVLQAAVTPLCTDAGGGPGITYSPANGNALHGTNFVTTVRYFAGATNCTASEVDLVGYTQEMNVSTCDTNTGITDTVDGSCVIQNQQDPVDIYASKIFTSGGATATFDLASCTGGANVETVTDSASPGSPAHYIISDFPWNGTTCDVIEPVPPSGYYEVASTCNDLVIVPSDDDTLCNITNAPTRATFEVTKEFTDGNNPTEVEVTINCFTGLPIEQSQHITEDQGVEFVVTDFDHEELDCEITEEDLFGYTATYEPASMGANNNDGGCNFQNVEGGAENTCHIVNDADPVDVDIEKLWVIEGSGGDQVDTKYKLTLYCDAEIAYATYCHDVKAPAVDSPEGNGGWTCKKNFYGDGSEVFTAHVTPEYPTSHCWVDEHVYDDAVEIDNDCGDLVISAGTGASCLITNTVFFEGIPTLSQYGMAIMALLMLGVGLVGFRRFS